MDDLRVPPGNRLEILKGDRQGQHRIRINELINGKRGITPSTALRLAKYFGTTPGFWMNLQLRWDLYRAQQVEARQLEQIEPYIASANSA